MNIFGSQVGHLYIAKFSSFSPQIVTILHEFFRVLQLALFTLQNNQILLKLLYYSTQELYLQWIAHSLSNEHPHQKISDLGPQRICQPKQPKKQTFSRARAIAFYCQYVSYVTQMPTYETKLKKVHNVVFQKSHNSLFMYSPDSICLIIELFLHDF